MAVSINDEYDVKILSVSSDGNGVARVDGMAVFVPFTAPRDEVKIRITRVKNRYAEGKVTEILSPSPDRAAPDCPHYKLCGGCTLRHIKYDKQLDIKREIVENAMRRIGGFKDFALEEIIGAENPSRYRNKTVFHAGKNGMGFYSQKSDTVTPVGDCALGAAENAAITKAAARCGAKTVFTRKSFSTGEIAVSVTAEGADAATLVKSLAAACKSVSGIFLNGEKVYGSDTITETLCGVKFKISPESFFQVNPPQTEKLYKKALEYAAAGKTQTVLDIYCGIGSITLCAAKTAKRVIGVEIVEKAVEDAKENARLNGVANAEFYAGGAEKIVPALIRGGVRPDVVILDPPRKGSDEKTLGAIVKAKPERVVYVSCNPSTLARDARYLADNGYTISRASAADLFPHTNHIETVCLLSKLNVKQHIEVELTMDEMDLTAAEKKASYEEIKEYVLEKFGMKVSHLYIAQVKRKCGIIERENYNKPKSEDSRQPKCPPEKEAAIRAALEHFKMI